MPVGQCNWCGRAVSRDADYCGDKCKYEHTSRQSESGLPAYMGLNVYHDLGNSYYLQNDSGEFLTVPSHNLGMSVFDWTFWVGTPGEGTNFDYIDIIEIGLISTGVMWNDPFYGLSSSESEESENVILQQIFVYGGLRIGSWQLGLGGYLPAYFSNTLTPSDEGVERSQAMFRGVYRQLDLRLFYEIQTSTIYSWSVHWAPMFQGWLRNLEIVPEFYQLLQSAEGFIAGFKNLSYTWNDTFTVSMPITWKGSVVPSVIQPGFRYQYGEMTAIYGNAIIEPLRDGQQMAGGTLGRSFSFDDDYLTLNAFVSYNDQSVFPNYSQTMPLVLGIEAGLGTWSDEPEPREESRTRDARQIK
ncbi:MAG: hypothetical protein ACLFR1_16370 [Spirochaetia bacterium]